MQVHDKIYIDGAWVPSTGSGTIDVFDSTDESVIGRIPEGTAEDVDRAAKAARAAFDPQSAACCPATCPATACLPVAYRTGP